MSLGSDLRVWFVSDLPFWNPIELTLADGDTRPILKMMILIMGFGIHFGSWCFHLLVSRECSLALPKPTSATACLATRAVVSNENSPPQLQILSWSEPYYMLEVQLQLPVKRKAPPTTIFFFSALKNSPPKINWTYTKYRPIRVVMKDSLYTWKSFAHIYEINSQYNGQLRDGHGRYSFAALKDSLSTLKSFTHMLYILNGLVAGGKYHE